MMIYKKPWKRILSCDPRACLATGAMGKPQNIKRVPIVKHENQPPPLLLFVFLFSHFVSNTPPPARGAVLQASFFLMQVSCFGERERR